jgi:hypothetical protein
MRILPDSTQRSNGREVAAPATKPRIRPPGGSESTQCATGESSENTLTEAAGVVACKGDSPNAMRMAPAGGNGFRIDSEVTLLTMPRGNEELRVTVVEATTDRGKRISWHSLRVFYLDRASGEMRPGKQGITLRGNEIAPLLEALTSGRGGS